ncbi:MAG: hypothetical protein NTV24_00375 [Candidatus Woesebacteria bacterium]|nr:hypothetical protein [Candidatus Woesebacteria bacterium]
MERINVPRGKKLIGGGSIETLEPFCCGEAIAKAFPHLGPNGEKHKGNMRVKEVISTLRFVAQAACVQADCDVTVELTGVPRSS